MSYGSAVSAVFAAHRRHKLSTAITSAAGPNFSLWPGGILEVAIHTRHQQNSKQWNAGGGTSTNKRDGELAMKIQAQCPLCIKHGPEYRGLPCPTCNTVGDGPWTLVEGRLYHVRCVKKVPPKGVRRLKVTKKHKRRS